MPRPTLIATRLPGRSSPSNRYVGERRGAAVVGDDRREAVALVQELAPSGRSGQSRLTAQRIVPSVVDDARRADADAEDRLVRAARASSSIRSWTSVERRVAVARRRGRVRRSPAQLAAEVDEGRR